MPVASPNDEPAEIPNIGVKLEEADGEGLQS